MSKLPINNGLNSKCQQRIALSEERYGIRRKCEYKLNKIGHELTTVEE
jgi:hypothetical protein